MTRSVRDAAIVLSAMTAVDPRDEATQRRPASLPTDYTIFLDPAALAGKRIGVEKSFLKVHEKVDAILAKAIDQMKAQGAEIVEVDFKGKLEPIGENEYKVLQYEFKDGLNRYLSATEGAVRSLKDVIAYNSQHSESTMPFFGQEILVASEEKGDLQQADYKQALDMVVRTSQQAIDNTLREHRLDALCGPSTGPAWCTDLVNGDAFSGYGMGSGAAMAGYPSVTVPMGEVHGLPVGLLFMASAYTEASLLAIAFAYEQASRNRRSPSFRQTIL
jgi:amidase